ncbi:MAG TPA: LysR family transcriptional regulator [Deltaproteobacteria bacterium]|nr:LysR family transcriptional regulator [Deltaproteobacteria bacterium]
MKFGIDHSNNDIPIEHLEGIPAALAVHRLGSATSAAKRLGVGVATVLRRLERLEGELGCRLFDRLQRGMRPTRAMERIVPALEQIEASCRDVRREVAGLESRPEGVVRLATLPVLASSVLVPGLCRLRARYPALILELLPASAVVDLEGRRADLALRLSRPASGDLVARQVARFPLGAYASSPLAAELASCPPSSWPWVDWAEEMHAQPESMWLRGAVAEPRICFRSSGLDVLLRAAVEGIGVVVAAAPLGEGYGLTALPMPQPAPEGRLYLVAHRVLRHAPRVAAVWDWALGCLQQGGDG